jgi:hypothetical protein
MSRCPIRGVKEFDYRFVGDVEWVPKVVRVVRRDSSLPLMGRSQGTTRGGSSDKCPCRDPTALLAQGLNAFTKGSNVVLISTAAESARARSAHDDPRWKVRCWTYPC